MIHALFSVNKQKSDNVELPMTTIEEVTSMFLNTNSQTSKKLLDFRRPLHNSARALLIVPILFLVGCALMTHYDPTSYKTATDLKAESLFLMDKATEAPDPAQLAKIDDMRR